MHGERDIITRFVLPELRSQAAARCVSLYEVDLRWGVTEEQSRKQGLEVCLREVSKAHLFIGLVGSRYGWRPESYATSDEAMSAWLDTQPPGLSITELEMRYAALCTPNNSKHTAFFFIRDTGFLSNVPKKYYAEFVETDDAAKIKLNKLKQRIRESGLEVFDNYPCRWGGVAQGKPMTAGLNELASRVTASLWTAIDRLCPSQTEQLDEETHITNLHDAYVEVLASGFVGREKAVRELVNRVKEQQGSVIAVHGKAGSGKSALMATAAQRLSSSLGVTSVMTHFCGAAPGSCHVVPLMSRVIGECRSRQGLPPITATEQYKNLTVKLEETFTSVASVSKSFVIFIDGLDLLIDVHQALTLDWMPDVPQNVTVVLSCVTNGAVHKACTRRHFNMHVLGALDVLDKSVVVRSTLGKYSKKLDENAFNNQMKLLVMKRGADSPLFLRLACEELRMFGQFEHVGRVLRDMPHTVPGLINSALDRLEQDCSHLYISTALSALAVVRNGLTEAELQALLSLATQAHNAHLTSGNALINEILTQKSRELTASADITRIVTGLRAMLQPSSSHNDPLLVISFSEVLKVVCDRYLASSVSGLNPTIRSHALLAALFYKQAHTNCVWNTTATRAYTELPYHLVCSGSYDVLGDVLCDLQFIQCKSYLGLADKLLEDFAATGQMGRAAERERGKFLSSERIVEFSGFVSRNMHIIKKTPALLLQQALNEPEISSVHFAALLLDTPAQLGLLRHGTRPALKDLPVYEACQLIIEELSEAVECVILSPDCTKFACGLSDGSIKIFAVSTGKELRTLHGHSGLVVDLCFVGSDRLCSAGADATVSLWNIEIGHRIRCMKDHSRRVGGVASDPTGRWLVSVGWDSRIIVWDPKTGVKKDELRREDRPLSSVAFHPTEDLICVGCWDKTVRVYNVFHKQRKAILRGHVTSVRAVSYSPSGKHLASAALDGSVKIWNAINGSNVGSLPGHTLPINDVTFTADGDKLATCSDDRTVKVWSTSVGRPHGVLGRADSGYAMSVCQTATHVYIGYHEGEVRCFNMSSGLQQWSKTSHIACVRALCVVNDDTIASASDDKTVKLLEARTGSVISSLNKHEAAVLCLAACKDFIASGSEDCCAWVWPIVNTKLRRCEVREHAARQIRDHSAPVSAVAFSEDHYLATACRAATIHIFSTSDGLLDKRPLTTIYATHNDWVTALAWCPVADRAKDDQVMLVTGSNDNTLKMWNVFKPDSDAVEFIGHTSPITGCDVTPSVIVSASQDGCLKLWSKKGTEVGTIKPNGGKVNACKIHMTLKDNPLLSADKALEDLETDKWEEYEDLVEEEFNLKSKLRSKGKSPKRVVDDTLLCAVCDDGFARLWKPFQPHELSHLQGHGERVQCVSAQKDLVISASKDGSARVWKPLSPDQLQSTEQAVAEERNRGLIRGHDAQLSSMDVTRTGNKIISADRAGRVCVWEVIRDKTCKETRSDLKLFTSWQEGACAVEAVRFLESETLVAVLSCTGTITVNHVSKTGMLKAMSQMDLKRNALSMDVFSGVGELKLVVGLWRGFNDSLVVDKSKLVENNNTRAWSTPMDRYIPSVLFTRNNTYVADDTGCLFSKSDRWEIELPKKTRLGRNDVPKVVPRWITHMCEMTSGNILVGDTIGELTIFSQSSGDFEDSIKAHRRSISGVRRLDNFYVTSSLDASVKFWTCDLTQVGQVNVNAPVACLVTSEHAAHQVAVGDDLGQIRLYRWIPPLISPGKPNERERTVSADVRAHSELGRSNERERTGSVSLDVWPCETWT